MADTTFEPDDTTTFTPDPEPVAKPRKKMDLGAALVKGYAAGGAAGFDDELGAAEQFGLKWLAKHSPTIAAKMGIDPHAGDDDTLGYDQALKENRAEKRQAAKDHPYGYGLSSAAGAAALGSGAALAGAPAAALPAIQGAVTGVGEQDENRGLNWDTVASAAEGAGEGYVGGKVGQGVGKLVGKGIDKVGQYAGRVAQQADANILEEAGRRAMKESAQLAGAQGPPKAELVKNVLRLKAAMHDGTITPAELAQLKQLAPQFRDVLGDVNQEALENLATYVKPAPAPGPGQLFGKHLGDVEGEQMTALKNGIAKDVWTNVKKIPILGDTLEAGEGFVGAASKRLGSDVAKRGMGNAVQRALQGSPAFAEKYGRVIMGSSSPEVAHNVLQQRDPEYREMLKKALEHDDGSGNQSR